MFDYYMFTWNRITVEPCSSFLYRMDESTMYPLMDRSKAMRFYVHTQIIILK